MSEKPRTTIPPRFKDLDEVWEHVVRLTRAFNTSLDHGVPTSATGNLLTDNCLVVADGADGQVQGSSWFTSDDGVFLAHAPAVAGAFTRYLELFPDAPAIVATTPGDEGTETARIEAQRGGDTSIATTGIGGIGGKLTLLGGVGGVASSASTLSTGGIGGALTFTAGKGGKAVETGTNVGGKGGDVTINPGDGGDAAGGGSNTPGAPGDLYLGASGGSVNISSSSEVTSVLGDFHPAGFISLGPASTLTISAGVITATGSYHDIEPESGSSDTLDTINGGSDGDILMVRSGDTNPVITVSHATGNLRLAGGANFSLNNPRKRMMFQFQASVSAWCEVSRSNNS